MIETKSGQSHLGCLLDKNSRRQPWLRTRHLLCQQPRHLLCQQPRKLQQLQYQLQHLTYQSHPPHPGGGAEGAPARVSSSNQALRASTRRRPKADVVKVRPGLIHEWPCLPGHRLAKIWIFKNGLIGTLMAPNDVPISSPSSKSPGDAKYDPPGCPFFRVPFSKNEFKNSFSESPGVHFFGCHFQKMFLRVPFPENVFNNALFDPPCVYFSVQGRAKQ